MIYKAPTSIKNQGTYTRHTDLGVISNDLE